MNIESDLEEIEENWHGREYDCADWPKWHTGGFNKPFFGASSQESIEADVVFAGEEPGTGGEQAHEEWREAERVSLDEAADRVAQSEWSSRDFPVSSTAMFTDELLDIVTGTKSLDSSVDQQHQFDHYITNLEKCHERYDEPDDDAFDESEYVGDQFYDDDYTTDKTAADCCSSYLRTEVNSLGRGGPRLF